MPTKCQHIWEQPSLADASHPDAGHCCGDGQPKPTHPFAVYPQYFHFGSEVTPVGIDPLRVARSSDGSISGVLQSASSVPTAVVPSSQPHQQQTVSHVLLPVVASSSPWQQPTCRWVMPSTQQDNKTCVIQSPVVAAQQTGAGLCHPSQALCCQHPSQLGPLHSGDTGCFSNFQKGTATQKDKNQASTARNNESNVPSTATSRPDFAGILNKVMINTSDKLMALLDQELDRMEEEKGDFSDLEDMDTTPTHTAGSVIITE